MASHRKDATPMWDTVSPEDDKALREKFVEESNKVISRWSLGNASCVEKDAAVSFLVQLGVVQITVQSDIQEDSQKQVSIQFGHELYFKTETEYGSVKQVETNDAMPISSNSFRGATLSQDQDTEAKNQTHIDDDEEEEDNNYNSAWMTEPDDEGDDDEMQISDKTPVVTCQQPKEEHPCPDCHVILNSTWDLDLHRLHDCAKPVKSIQYVYNCEECSKSFTKRFCAVTHLRKAHNIAPMEVVEKLAQMKETQSLKSSKEPKKRLLQLGSKHLCSDYKTNRDPERKSRKPPVLKSKRKETKGQMGVLMEEGEFEDQQVVKQQKQSGKKRRRGKASNWNSEKYSCLLSKTPRIKLQPLANGWMKVLENEAIDVSKFVPIRTALAATVSSVERSKPVHAPNDHQGLNCKAGNDNPNPLHEDESLDISEESVASADMPKQQTVEEDIGTSLSALSSDELPDQGDAVEEVEGKHEENLIPRRGPEDVKENTERENSATISVSQNSEDEVEESDSNKEVFKTDEHQDPGCPSRQREEDNQDVSTDPDIGNERQRTDPNEGIGEPSVLTEHKKLPELSDKEECKNDATSKKSTEKEENSKTCPFCDLQFKTSYKRRKHICEVHEEYEQMNFACSTCGKSFICKFELKAHVKTHLDKETRKTYHCKICDKTLLSKYNYKDHMRMHSKDGDQSKKFRCDTCGKGFTAKRNLIRHVNCVHIKEVKFTCEVCGKKFYSDEYVKLHMDIHKNKRPFKCEECGKGFIREHQLRAHFQKVHANAEQCICDICGSSFKTKGSLKQHHLTAHPDVFEYSCDVCGKKFKRTSHLNAHVKIHSNDPCNKPFKCKLCSKGFRNSHKLEVHMNWHNNIRSHTCFVCGKSFLTKGNLDKHLYTHKNKKPHECSVCSRGFVDLPGLRKHMDLVHKTTLKMLVTKGVDEARGKATQESESDVSVHKPALRSSSTSSMGSDDSDGDSSKYGEPDHQEKSGSSSVAHVSETSVGQEVREALLAIMTTSA